MSIFNSLSAASQSSWKIISVAVKLIDDDWWWKIWLMMIIWDPYQTSWNVFVCKIRKFICTENWSALLKSFLLVLLSMCCLKVPEAFQNLINQVDDTLKHALEEEENVLVSDVINFNEVCLKLSVKVAFANTSSTAKK